MGTSTYHWHHISSLDLHGLEMSNTCGNCHKQASVEIQPPWQDFEDRRQRQENGTTTRSNFKTERETQDITYYWAESRIQNRTEFDYLLTANSTHLNLLIWSIGILYTQSIERAPWILFIYSESQPLNGDLLLTLKYRTTAMFCEPIVCHEIRSEVAKERCRTSLWKNMNTCIPKIRCLW